MRKSQYFMALFIGFVIGLALSYLFNLKSTNTSFDDFQKYDDHFHNLVSNDSLETTHFHKHSNDIRTVANNLSKDVRILCWVMTSPKNHDKAIHVQNSWGKRCNKLLFMSSESDEQVGTIALPNVSEGRSQLWGKTREAYKYIYENHFDDADWFYKADDDTYAIMENMRYLLSAYLPETPVFFGHKFKIIVKNGYMSGGPGYILSKEAVRRFVEIAYPNKSVCRHDNGGAEDAEMGKCLQNIGVIAGDSRDNEFKGTFFPLVLDDHVFNVEPLWYWKNNFYKNEKGVNGISDHLVAFHYVKPVDMYVVEFMIYHLRLFGVTYSYEELPKKLSVETAIELFKNRTCDNFIP